MVDLTGLHAALTAKVDALRNQYGHVETSAFVGQMVAAIEAFVAQKEAGGPVAPAPEPTEAQAALAAFLHAVGASVTAVTVVPKPAPAPVMPALPAPEEPVDGASLPPITGTLDLSQKANTATAG